MYSEYKTYTETVWANAGLWKSQYVAHTVLTWHESVDDDGDDDDDDDDDDAWCMMHDAMLLYLVGNACCTWGGNQSSWEVVETVEVSASACFFAFGI